MRKRWINIVERRRCKAYVCKRLLQKQPSYWMSSMQNINR